MDFTALHKGVATVAATIATAVNLTFAPASPPTIDPNLQYPALISSYNLPDEVVEPTQAPVILTDLAVSDDKDLKLEMVTKEPEQSEVVTVEEPPVVYTVAEPTPVPSELPKVEEPKESEESDESKEPNVEVEESKAEKVVLPEPSVQLVKVAGSSNSETLFQMVNDHRAKIGKPAFEKDDRLCKIADQRAPQVDGELADGTLHKGFKALNLPYWATENIAAYQTIEDDFKFWLSDYIHKAAIESDHKYSCVACTGASCSQIFSSFVSK